MRSRQDLAEIFSTYIDFDADRFKGWLAEPRLRKNFDGHVRQLIAVDDRQAQGTESKVLENTWALYWHQHWQTNTDKWAFLHLVAYLQETGFWVADDITARFQPKQFSLADCFQIAFAKLDLGLKKFQPDRGRALAGFINMFFRSTITNELRRAKEVDICSDWLLLRKTSRKRFVESLQRAGLGAIEVERYRLAWLCFQQLYAPFREPGVQQLPPPSQAIWEQTAALYNRERASQLSATGQAVTAAEIEDWMERAIAYIRQYLQPTPLSLNTTVAGMETGELQDNLPAPELSPFKQLLEKAERTERQSKQQALRHILVTCFNNLSPDEQMLLTLYYRDKLTQTKIGTQLGLKQFKVCRQLTRLRKRLLNALIDQVKPTGSTTAQEQTEIDTKYATQILELWLQRYFENDYLGNDYSENPNAISA